MPLSTHDSYRIRQYYESALKLYGESNPKSVHWSDAHNQRIRFEALLGVADITRKSILDVGSGLGDLYKLIKERGFAVNYTGIDIIPDFIARSQRRYPEARFMCKDIFDLDERFDIVLASGALSFKVKNNENYYQGMIKKMYDRADEALAFNMLNINSHVDDGTYAAYSPEKIADFCKTFCDRVEIVLGYLPQDFTMYLYKK